MGLNKEMTMNPYKSPEADITPAPRRVANWIKKALCLYVLVIPLSFYLMPWLEGRANSVTNWITVDQAKALNRVFELIVSPPETPAEG